MGEPRGAPALAQERAQLRLEGPRAEVRRDVEAGVDVAQVVRRARLDLQRVGEELDVAGLERAGVARGVELELVEELRRVAAHEPEELQRAIAREALRVGEVEAAREPGGVV